MNPQQPKIVQQFLPAALPRNRKELVVRYNLAIERAIERGHIDGIINILIEYMITALPEIKEEGYDKDVIFSLEPTYEEVKKEYLKHHKLLFPEMIYQFEWRIEEIRKEKYLRRLQKHRRNLEQTLKDDVGWMFDDDLGRTEIE